MAGCSLFGAGKRPYISAVRALEIDVPVLPLRYVNLAPTVGTRRQTEESRVVLGIATIVTCQWNSLSFIPGSPGQLFFEFLESCSHVLFLLSLWS